MNEIKIHITLGNQKHLGIDKYGNLICFALKDGVVTDYINLGPFTQQRYEELKGYFERLSIHTVG